MTGLNNLSPEVISEILSFLSPSSLRRLRCLNRQIGELATVHAFRHIRLQAALDTSSPKAFLRIAQSDKLRSLVREITCDTCVSEDEDDEIVQGPDDIPNGFMNTLPLLRFFENLNTLNVRFSRSCAHTIDTPLGDLPKQTTDFRYRVLDIVFQCLAGTWSASRQKEIDNGLNLRFDANYDTDKSLANISVGPLPMTKLAVCNLGDYDDKRLTESEAFKTALASSKLTQLQLLIAVQRDFAAPEYEVHMPDKYHLFESLPSTWLSPAVAENLTTLSLYCRDYWGWNPKMDFRAVRPGNGPDSGFPRLKVLALGKYVFSHTWQVDWFASLGQLNGHGGLQELYLDDCPIMFKARYFKPLDQGTTIVGQDADGKDIEVSNEGYHRKELVFPRFGRSRGDGGRLAEMGYPLRWHSVLTQWRESMTAIKIFKMGHGSLDGPPHPLSDSFQFAATDYEGELALDCAAYSDAAFQCYDAPSPPPDDAEPEDVLLQKYTRGSGLSQIKRDIMQYASFRGSGMENLRDARHKYKESVYLDDTAAKDDAALELFMSSIDSRRREGAFK